MCETFAFPFGVLQARPPFRAAEDESPKASTTPDIDHTREDDRKETGAHIITVL